MLSYVFLIRPFMILLVNSELVTILRKFDNRPGAESLKKKKKVLRRIFSFWRHTSKMSLVREQYEERRRARMRIEQ